MSAFNPHKSELQRRNIGAVGAEKLVTKQETYLEEKKNRKIQKKNGKQKKNGFYFEKTVFRQLSSHTISSRRRRTRRTDFLMGVPSCGGPEDQKNRSKIELGANFIAP